MPIHLQTPPNKQSPLVLCPGDPDRATLVATELLEGAECVTRTRALLGFTGRYKGVEVTIQTTGMGGGSTGTGAPRSGSGAPRTGGAGPRSGSPRSGEHGGSPRQQDGRRSVERIL